MGPEGGSTKKPKGREINADLLNTCGPKKFINDKRRKGKIGPSAQARSVVDRGEMSPQAV